jgi:hypothetical protein
VETQQEGTLKPELTFTRKKRERKPDLLTSQDSDQTIAHRAPTRDEVKVKKVGHFTPSIDKDVAELFALYEGSVIEQSYPDRQRFEACIEEGFSISTEAELLAQDKKYASMMDELFDNE